MTMHERLPHHGPTSFELGTISTKLTQPSDDQSHIYNKTVLDHSIWSVTWHKDGRRTLLPLKF